MAVQLFMIEAMNNNFDKLDTKYHTISENLAKLGDELPKNIASELARVLKND